MTGTWYISFPVPKRILNSVRDLINYYRQVHTPNEYLYIDTVYMPSNENRIVFCHSIKSLYREILGIGGPVQLIEVKRRLRKRYDIQQALGQMLTYLFYITKVFQFYVLAYILAIDESSSDLSTIFEYREVGSWIFNNFGIPFKIYLVNESKGLVKELD